MALFGYPTSEMFQEINPDTGEILPVQYFERARMEYHRDNPDPYKVLLGRLGANTLIRQRRTSGNEPALPTPGAGCQTFTETPCGICPPLRTFWNRSGGLSVFGLPLTQAGGEQSQTDAKTYQTQWFERERLEYHPKNAVRSMRCCSACSDQRNCACAAICHSPSGTNELRTPPLSSWFVRSLTQPYDSFILLNNSRDGEE